MATRIQGSAKCSIPIVYKCAQCGARCRSVIPVSGNSKSTYSPMNGSMRDQRGDAEFDALVAMAGEIGKVYSDTPLNCHRPIVGKCDSCGNVEPWQISPEKHKATGLLTTIAVILFGLSCLMIPLALAIDPLLLIPVFVLGLLVLALKVVSSQQKSPSKTKQALIDAIPEENKPTFACSLEEMLKSIGLSSAQANQLILQKSDQEDSKDTKSDIWVCSSCGKKNSNTDIMCKSCGEYR